MATRARRMDEDASVVVLERGGFISYANCGLPYYLAGPITGEEKLLLTNHAKVMDCLPVRRNVELSDEVLDGFSSIVTQQASNRVWAAQAVLSELLAAKAE